MTTYYFDYDNGSDANTGLTKADPLQNLPGSNGESQNSNFTPQPGDELLLARGSTWPITFWLFFNDVPVDKNKPILIDAYDRPGESNQDKPILDNLDEITSGWTLSGTSGVWQASLTGTVNRVFFEYIGQNSGATSIVTCTASTPWWWDDSGKILYVYTGSDVNNPNTTHGQIHLIREQGGNAGLFCIGIQQTGNLIIRNLNMLGGNYGIQMLNNSTTIPTDGLLVENCEIEYSPFGVFVSTSVNANHTGSIIIRNNYIDRVFFENENLPSTEIGGDGIYLNGGYNNNAIIENNHIKDQTHAGINIRNGASTIPAIGCIVRNNYIEAPNTLYGRAIGVNSGNASTSIEQTYIYNNYMVNMPTRTQIEGIYTYFFNNVIDGTVDGTVIADSSQGVSSSARDTADVDHVYIFNNTIKNTTDEAIRLVSQSGYAIDNYFCFNNVVTNDTGYSSLCFKYTEALAYTGTILVSNNIFYNENTASSIDWDTVTYTVDTAPSEFSRNRATDPQLDGTFISSIYDNINQISRVVDNYIDANGIYKSGKTIGAVAPKIPTVTDRRQF